MKHPEPRRKGIAVIALISALCSVASGVLAQTHDGNEAAAYPSKPLRFILGFTPGGGTDTVARLIGQRLNNLPTTSSAKFPSGRPS